MTLIGEACLDRIEGIVARLAEDASEKFLPALKSMLMPKPSDPVSPAETLGDVVITTRRGVQVAVNEEAICVCAENDVVRADWEEVPAFIACLRGAIVPEYRKDRVDPYLAQVSLEMASGFGHPVEGPEEVLFTADDAEDITRDYALAKLCPHPQIASEITHVHKIGPRKLFKYIESEVVSL